MVCVCVCDAGDDTPHTVTANWHQARLSSVFALATEGGPGLLFISV